MDASELFLDCPAYLDRHGTVRCGLPAEVEYLYAMTSTDGVVESARIRCPLDHYFNGPVEAFGDQNPTATPVNGGLGGQQDAAARPPGP